MRKRIAELVAVGGLVALLSGCAEPTIEEHKDLTGDDIPDIVVNINNGFQAGTWLFIGQEDGSFVRAKNRTIQMLNILKPMMEQLISLTENFIDHHLNRNNLFNSFLFSFHTIQKRNL